MVRLWPSRASVTFFLAPPENMLELPEYVLRHVVLGEGVHHEVLVAGGAVAGPVLGTLLPSHLTQLRQHHHDRAVVLPQHPPEVLYSLRQRALGRNVGVPIPVSV